MMNIVVIKYNHLMLAMNFKYSLMKTV